MGDQWVFDEVPTSCGRCFRIGTQAEIDQPKHERPRLPSYACLYDDWGRGENATKAKAALIVKAVNSHAGLVAALNQIADNPGMNPADMVSVAEAALASWA